MLVTARELNAGDRIRWYSTDLVVETIGIKCGVVTVSAGRERLMFLAFERVERVERIDEAGRALPRRVAEFGYETREPHARVQVEFHVDAAEVIVDGVAREEQVLRNSGIREPLGHEPCDLPLAF